MQHRVLLVGTSCARLGHSAQASGVWLEELAQAYFTLREAGAALSIATPLGGQVPLDPASCNDPWLSELGKRLLEDKTAAELLSRATRLADVVPASVDALYIVGGAGAMTDLPGNHALGQLLEALSAGGRPIAAVCHGVAGLAFARGSDGSPFVANRKLTCFSNMEEEQVGYVAYLEVLPETLLRGLGAVYSSGEPWFEHVVSDGLLLTGQNPASAGPLARKLAGVLAGRS